jgi:hypothetical protein
MSPWCRPRRQLHSLRSEPFPFMLTCPGLAKEQSGPRGRFGITWSRTASEVRPTAPACPRRSPARSSPPTPAARSPEPPGRRRRSTGVGRPGTPEASDRPRRAPGCRPAPGARPGPGRRCTPSAGRSATGRRRCGIGRPAFARSRASTARATARVFSSWASGPRPAGSRT